MAAKWNPRRRRFLEAAASAAAAGYSAGCSGPKGPWRTLTAREGETAAAACECIIPTDEYPGAAWAGAVAYIDLQLCGHLKKYRGAYRQGLAALDGAAGGNFAALPQPRQVELLKLVEKGKAKAPGWTPEDQRAFFALILAHTMQSYYGDPRHGGNRDQVGYRMLGVPASPVRGRSQHDLTGGKA